MNRPQFHQPGHIFLLSLWICVSKCSAKDDGKSWADGNYTSHTPPFLIPDETEKARPLSETLTQQDIDSETHVAVKSLVLMTEMLESFWPMVTPLLLTTLCKDHQC